MSSTGDDELTSGFSDFRPGGFHVKDILRLRDSSNSPANNSPTDSSPADSNTADSHSDNNNTTTDKNNSPKSDSEEHNEKVITTPTALNHMIAYDPRNPYSRWFHHSTEHLRYSGKLLHFNKFYKFC